MPSNSNKHQPSNLDVAAHVKQAQLMRNEVITEMFRTGWQGTRRIVRKLANSSSSSHGVTAPTPADR